MKKISVSHVTEKDTYNPDRESPPGVLRRVKGLANIALVVLLLFAFFCFTGIVGNLTSASGMHMSPAMLLFARVQGGQLL